MALLPGTLEIGPKPNYIVTGDGLALAIYDAMFRTLAEAASTKYLNGYIRRIHAQGGVAFCVPIATVLIDYLVANAEISVTVGTGDAGLQRDPDTSTDTLAPSSEKTLSGSLT